MFFTETFDFISYNILFVFGSPLKLFLGSPGLDVIGELMEIP